MILMLAVTVYYLSVTAGAKLDYNKLIGYNSNVSIYDQEDNLISNQSNNIEVIKLKNLPSYVKNSFVAIEDKRFYEHHGVDYKGIARALFNNIKSFSFKEGASTITQQLIKNSHLSSDKTFKRKLIELKLAKDLEKKLSKDEILETYLNTIYFGDNCYGIKKAANHYFSKNPENLTVGESATLAGIVKSPANFSPTLNYEKSMERKDLVLSAMYSQKYIEKEEYKKYYNEKIEIKSKENSEYGYNHLLNLEINKFLDKNGAYGKDYKIYTYFDGNIQKNIENIVKNKENNYNTCKLSTELWNVYIFNITIKRNRNITSKLNNK